MRIALLPRRGGLAATSLLAFAGLAFGMAASLAQTRTPSAGQLVPPSLAPEVRMTPGGIALPAPPETGAPPGAEKLSLEVGDVAVEGGDPALATETKAALEPIRGRKVSVAEIYMAAGQIERAYAAQGYFLTRVIIPPQTVKPKGALKLLIVQGFIESVDGSALPERVRDRATAVVGRVVDQRRLTLAAFERALLIAGDTAGLDLATRLTIGTKPGGVRLVLNGTYRPAALELSGDNSLSHSLGLWTATASGSLNSVFGFGEQIYVNLTGAPTHDLGRADSPRRLAAAGVVLPIGLDGLTVNLEGAWSDTKPIVDDPLLATTTDYERLSLRLAYPLLRTRTDTLLLHGVFDAISEKQQFTAFDFDFYDDQIRALRLGADWSHAISPAALASAGVTVSQGIDALGARGTSGLSAVSTGVSTLGAEPDFTKLEGQLRFSQALPANFSTEVIARGQYSFGQPLYKSEQFSLGGPHLLSAYDAGDISGDSGWLLRGELRYDHLAQTGWATALMQPYLFASHGAVSLAEPTVLERSTVVASALGAGARFTAAPNLAYLRELELGIEGARQYSDELDKNGWRFNLYLAARY